MLYADGIHDSLYRAAGRTLTDQSADAVRCRRLEGEDLVLTFIDTDNYTLGERIAGRALLEDPCWFYLHGTGVFYRQAVGR